MANVTYRAVDAFCPDCQLPLVAHPIEDYPALGCDRCDGLWLEESVLRALYELRNERRMPDLIEFPDGSPPRSCGVCREPMVHHIFEMVTTDVCATHGVWLDAGELEGILNRRTDLEALGFVGIKQAQKRNPKPK